MTDEEAQAAHDLLEQWQVVAAQMFERLREEMQPIIKAVTRLWTRIATWIERQGIFSPAYAYATPAMRLRAARQRAHLAMQAKNRQRRQP